ncbi:glycoside hydrolase family 104 protein [Agrobacterium tumefaciens]|nr:glycoside hydrolase family 104 protein [Agrobacterium tumefaciens]
MTYGNIIDAQADWGNKTWVRSNWGHKTASSAAGRYQFMRATLQGIAKEVRSIDGRTIFSSDLQDRLGYYLLLRRGYADFIAGKLNLVQFGLNLAKEWASFPVLSNTSGAHRSVSRGQSYYAGDGLNKSLIKPEQVEQRLRHVRELAALMTVGDTSATLSPKPSEPEQSRDGKPAAPAVPVSNVDPEKLDKPLLKSKTVWQWIITTIILPLVAVITNPWVQAFLIAIVSGFAIYAIKRRSDIAKVYREIKAEFDA